MIYIGLRVVSIYFILYVRHSVLDIIYIQDIAELHGRQEILYVDYGVRSTAKSPTPQVPGGRRVSATERQGSPM